MKLISLVCLVFLVGCYSIESQFDPRCIFETEFCFGSSLEEFQLAYPDDLIPQGDEFYQYVVFDQDCSKTKQSANIHLSRVIHLRFDEHNSLEEFAVSFLDFSSFDAAKDNFWSEFVKAIGKDQLTHYKIENPEAERPWKYKDSLIDPAGVKIIHKFNVHDIIRIHIKVRNTD